MDIEVAPQGFVVVGQRGPAGEGHQQHRRTPVVHVVNVVCKGGLLFEAAEAAGNVVAIQERQ